MVAHPVRRSPLAVLVLALGLLPSLSSAQQASISPQERHERYARHVAMQRESPFRGLPWQFVGPTNVSGRITDVAPLDPRGDSYAIYVAAASGGVWKTVNEGVTWEPVFDEAPSTSIGDVTVAPSNQDIVWIGTGEANIFRSSMAGAGVYKSTDGGHSWEHKGLTATHTIPRIVIHPTDPDTVYVASSGHEWTPNPERGVYKTTDGGDSWDKVLYVDDTTGVIDLVMDPSDPDTLYAATWQRVRKKWNDPRNESGYTGSGIWKTTDGGASWNPIDEGLPDPRYRGRIGIDVARSNPDVVYAFIDNYEVAQEPDPGETDAYGRPASPLIRGATVYRSDDGGASWTRTSEQNDYMLRLGGTYGWVFGQIRVDPQNEDKIYVLGLNLNVSEDRGKTFRRLTGMHGDHHGLWIDPSNPDYLVNDNDGGVDISYDGGATWRNFNDNLPLAQFFNVAVDNGEPFRAYGSIQDHGSFRGVVDLSRGRNNVPAVDWDRAPGGEGSSHAIDPTDPATVYSAGFYGNISRTNMDTGESVNIMPETEEGEPPLRGQWVAPFILSPHNPRILYHGLNKLYRSMDRGDSWEAISPDLTYNELDKIGDIPYQTIYSISESPLKFGRVYVGTDDGRVWVTDQAGNGGWSEITGELPRGKFIAEIVASHHDLNTVYLVQNGKRDDDFVPYVWKSTDAGATWEDMADGIPIGPVNVIEEDSTDPNVLYLGTDVGTYVTIDGGVTWQVLGGGLPSTFVQDMDVQERDEMLVAATHGRGMWTIDLRPIRALAKAGSDAGLKVLETEDMKLPSGFGFFFGGGLPRASVVYWSPSGTEVTAEVLDGDGQVVKTLDAPGEAGINVAYWDLTSDVDTGERRGFGPRFAAPGAYTVRLRAGDAEASAEIELSR